MEVRSRSRNELILMKHWCEKFLMRRHTPYSCGDFVEEVLFDQYGFRYNFPKSVKDLEEDTKSIKGLIGNVLVRTENPTEGDIAVMGGKRHACHVGIFIEIKNTKYILHSDINIKYSVLTKCSDLFYLGYFIEGFYSWRK